MCHFSPTKCQKQILVRDHHSHYDLSERGTEAIAPGNKRHDSSQLRPNLAHMPDITGNFCARNLSKHSQGRLPPSNRVRTDHCIIAGNYIEVMKLSDHAMPRTGNRITTGTPSCL